MKQHLAPRAFNMFSNGKGKILSANINFVENKVAPKHETDACMKVLDEEYHFKTRA